MNKLTPPLLYTYLCCRGGAYFIVAPCIVQSVKSIHQYFWFFLKRVANIENVELEPVSNERSGNFTFYKVADNTHMNTALSKSVFLFLLFAFKNPIRCGKIVLVMHFFGLWQFYCKLWPKLGVFTSNNGKFLIVFMWNMVKVCTICGALNSVLLYNM